MSREWNMPRRGEVCHATQRPFEVGEEFQVCLFETPEGYERRDYGLDVEPPTDPPPIASWRTRRPEPATRKVQPFDREAIYAFFTRLDDPQSPSQLQFRFALALLLWRKKVVRLDDTDVVDDVEQWRFVVPRTGEVHTVVRPELDEQQLEDLSTQLEQLLAGEAGDLEALIDTPDEEHRCE